MECLAQEVEEQREGPGGAQGTLGLPPPTVAGVSLPAPELCGPQPALPARRQLLARHAPSAGCEALRGEGESATRSGAATELGPDSSRLASGGPGRASFHERASTLPRTGTWDFRNPGSQRSADVPCGLCPRSAEVRSSCAGLIRFWQDGVHDDIPWDTRDRAGVRELGGRPGLHPDFGRYINIVPRKPAKMGKLKEIKPVVHCDMNVPSRWQMFHRMSRQINVFTNGRLFIPPVKIIIPKFSLMEWNSVLATVGEKVFPLGGVRKLFTMNGYLLDNSKDLQDNHFYVAAGLEAFKNFPYWKYPKVPSEIQQKYRDIEKHSRGKEKEDPKVKDTCKQDSVSPKAQDSVFYAKEGKKKRKAEPLIQSGADGDVFKAQTPNQETQGAPEVKEAPDVHVELPVDGRPAEIVKDAEETDRHTSDFESNREKEDEKLYEDNEREVCINRFCSFVFPVLKTDLTR
nr:doublecortin domain-containing protein 2C [Odocoileus virginianus texanus]